MLFYSEKEAREVWKFLERLSRRELADWVIFVLLNAFAFSKQRCRGRNCGTCGGGACVDSPSFSLGKFPTLEAAWGREKIRRAGRRPERDEVDEARYFVVPRLSARSAVEAFQDAREEYPPLDEEVFNRAWGIENWIRSREKLWG